jgi:hypothetical protein
MFHEILIAAPFVLAAVVAIVSVHYFAGPRARPYADNTLGPVIHVLNRKQRLAAAMNFGGNILFASGVCLLLAYFVQRFEGVARQPRWLVFEEAGVVLIMLSAIGLVCVHRAERRRQHPQSR